MNKIRTLREDKDNTLWPVINQKKAEYQEKIDEFK